MPPSSTEDQQAELIDLQTRRREAGHPPGLSTTARPGEDELKEPEVYAPKGCASNLTLSAETTAELLAREREKLTAPQDAYFEQLREHNRATFETTGDMSGDAGTAGDETPDRPEPPGEELDPDPWFARQAQAHLLPRRPASVHPAGVGSASLPPDIASTRTRARARDGSRARERPAGAAGRRRLVSLPRAHPRATIAVGVALITAAVTAGSIASSGSRPAGVRTSSSSVRAVDAYASTAGLFPSHHGIALRAQHQPVRGAARRHGRRLTARHHHQRHVLPARHAATTSAVTTSTAPLGSTPSTTPAGGSAPPVGTSPSPPAPVITNPPPGRSATSSTGSSAKQPTWGMNGSLGPGHGDGTG